MKRWFKVTKTKAGVNVKCTLVEDNMSVSWSVSTYANAIKAGVDEAQAGAEQALADLKAALR